jgi:hemerythrin-like domain-containing protein
MTATQNLENDHIHILQLTQIMQKMAERKTENVEHLELVVNLVRKFAEGFHHAKEEDLLFPMMGKKGFSPQQGPVAVMLAEHVQGRAFIKGVADGINAFKAGDRNVLESIYTNLEEYAFLLTAHIGKENNILFRMADQALSSEENAQLLVQFDDVEKHTETAYQTLNAINTINILALNYLIQTT